MTHVLRQLLSGVMVAVLLGEGEGQGTWKIGHFLEMIGQVDPFIPDPHKDAWKYELGNATKAGSASTSEVHIFPGSSHAFSIKYSTAFYTALAQLVGGNASRPRPDMVINSATADANNQTAIGVLLPPEGAPTMYPVGSSAAYYDHPKGTSDTAFGKADTALTAAGFGLSTGATTSSSDADLIMEPHMFRAPTGEKATAMERAKLPVPTMLSGFKIYQKSGASKRPGLLIFVGPYGDGGGYYEREVAKMYARKGMAVFLADYYPGTHGDTNPMTMFPALAEYSSNKAFGGQDYLSQTARAQATALRNLEQVRAWDIVDTSKVAVFGFCFGGAMSLQMARAGGEAAVVVSFHGEYPAAASDFKAVETDVAMRLGTSALETCLDVKKEFQRQGCCGMPTKTFNKGDIGMKSGGRRLSHDTLLDNVKLLLEEAKMQGGASHARNMAADLSSFVNKMAREV